MIFPGHGANCDGRTDDTAAINTALATLKTGGLARIAAGHFCLIDSGDLIIPADVRLVGAGSPKVLSWTTTGPLAANGIILNPAYTVVLQTGATLEHLMIERAGLVVEPTAEQVDAAVRQWGRETSVAVTIPRNIGAQLVNDVSIVGFNTCLKALAGGFSITRLAGDCYNGLEIASAGNNHYVNQVRFLPFYSFGLKRSTGAWERPGIAFHLHDGNTGGTFSQDEAYMWQTGMLINGIGVTQITQTQFEWQGRGFGLTGIRLVNGNAGVSFDHVRVAGYDTPISDEASGPVMFSNMTVSAGKQTQFYLAGRSAGSRVLVLGGIPHAGDVLSVEFTSSSIGKLPLTVTYTVRPSDHVTSVAESIEALINATPELIRARVYAAPNGIVGRGRMADQHAPPGLTVYWPEAITDMTIMTRATGDMTVANESGPPMAGSFGQISNTLANPPRDTAIFTIGQHAGRWNIVGLFNGNRELAENWLSVDPSSVENIRLSGIQWSAAERRNLSSCGTSPGLAARSTDTQGTIQEGEKATGCVLNFTTPFFTKPFCVVSSPDGSPITGYSATETALVIRNPPARHNRYSYRCDP